MKIKIRHSKSIFWQLIFFSLFISFVPILIISWYLYSKMKGMLVNEARRYNDQISLQYSKNIKEKLNQYQAALGLISDNTLILNTLEDPNLNPFTRGNLIGEEVAKTLIPEEPKEIYNCMVYSMKEEFPAYGKSVTMLKEAEREQWFENEMVFEGNISTVYRSDEKRSILSFFKKISKVDLEQFKRIDLGLVKLDLNTERLFAPAGGEKGEEPSYHVVICNKEGNILYSSNKEKIAKGQPYSEGARNFDVDAYVERKIPFEQFGLTAVFLFEKAELVNRRWQIGLSIFHLTVLLGVFIFAGTYYYSRNFSSRIALLVKKFKIAETGDMNLREPISGGDEIAYLDQKFSHMLTELDKLIQTNYIQRLENKETQLRNLQLQINPHFLYNTLETISAMAAVKHAFEVCEMCQKLGGIFRYSLGKNYGEYVTLEEELNHTKNYIYIQKIRYGNKFEVFYNIEVEEKKCYCLRFILQPIVENAILHGIGKTEEVGSIEISACIEDEKLVIRVADDGIGMDQQKRNEINAYINAEQLSEEGEKSIGLRNVHQRLRLAFGNNYGVKIDSTLQRGSCLTLTLPLLSGERET